VAHNYFAEVEQAAFSPSLMIPGIEPSADPVLQSRLFSYPDTHRHRLGTNYQQQPVNQPHPADKMANFQRDGAMAYYNQCGRANYLSTLDPIEFRERAVDLDSTHGKFVDHAVLFLSTIRAEDFNAPRMLWEKVFIETGRDRWINTVSAHMSTVRDKKIITHQIAIFREVSEDLACHLEETTGVNGGPGIKGVVFNGCNNGMDPAQLLTANHMSVHTWQDADLAVCLN
jgi:catalase